MITVKKYSCSDIDEWNGFNRQSKNHLFMFDRNYMDYHRDRFIDCSLMFYSDDELVATFPASEKNGVLASHGGLTYGGFISSSKMKQHTMIECIEALVSYSKRNGFKQIIYKSIPHIYHEQPAEEDRYALFLIGAKLMKVEASTVVNLKVPMKMPKGRKAQISRARREGVIVQELTGYDDFCRFIDLENAVLLEHHNAKAVHTGAELAILHDRFPEYLHLVAALKEGKLIAGTVIFEYGQVVHTQYMAANDEARTIGALDLAVSETMEKYKTSKLWFDFGKSTEGDGTYLNKGLIAQKEGFGGRTNVYETWEIDI